MAKHGTQKVYRICLLLAIVLVSALACTRPGPVENGRRPKKSPANPLAMPQPVVPSDTQLAVERFHMLWYGSRDTWYKNQWLGVPTRQNPLDVWVTQEIIVEQAPDIIVETGTFRGGSALLWATILQQVKPSGRVITVDIEDMTDDARLRPLWNAKVEFFLGSSVDPDILAEIGRRCQGKRVLVILDSDHTKGHVLKELRAYARLIPTGGYLIVQDTNSNGHPVTPNSSPGPYEAVEEFLMEDNRFEPDRTRERLLMTFNPNGFLKKVR